jgi:hypothetical protein
MSKLWYCLVVFALLALLAGSAFGQDLVVPTLKASGKYLNEVIANDSIGRPALRTYVLQRDSVYFVNALIRNVGWTLRMKAGTTGKYKPVVFLMKQSGAALNPLELIDVMGDVYLQNIHMSGYNELTPAFITDINQALLWTDAENCAIVIDSCILANIGQTIIRTTSAPRVVKVSNTIFANMGYCGGWDPGNGRAVDLRNGSCDSLIFQNNTVINNGDRVIRHYSSTAPIKYLLVDHNTIVNNYAFHGTFSFGQMGNKGIITNNLFINPFALGNDTDVVRQAEFIDTGEKDRFGQPRMVWISSVPSDTTQWTIRNNYYSVSTVEQNWFSANAAAGVTGEGSPLPYGLNKKITDSVHAFQKVSVSLTNAPEISTAFMDWYRSPTGANKTKQFASWSLAKDYKRVSFVYLTDSLNCKYPTTASIYTAADGGKPVGALTWWNLALTSVEKIEGEVPSSFSLAQNYPNPFNPSTTLQYTVSKSSHVVLEVFNVLGQTVARLVDDVQSPGTYKTTFNASRLSSGVYMYRLQAGDFVQTQKMVLMK